MDQDVCWSGLARAELLQERAQALGLIDLDLAPGHDRLAAGPGRRAAPVLKGRDAVGHRRSALGEAGERRRRQPEHYENLALSHVPNPDAHLTWWAVTGSNRRPSRCKRDALPAELTAPDQET